METAAEMRDWLVDRRRSFHQYPEPGWCEFWTTDQILAELDALPVDDVRLGRDIHAADARASVPDEETLAEWRDRASDAGADPDRLDRMAGGFTGAVATIELGDGPTIALRVDVDALPNDESTDPDHVPETEGFRSTNDGYMHACGHDAHMTMGLGVIRRLVESEFAGTLKVIFQPSEELIGGAKPIAESGAIDDVDYLLATHIGLDYPTGDVVAGLEGFLAVSQFRVTFTGEPAHAGASPNEGHDAVQALADAVQGLHAIPRHQEGITRVNAGRVEGGTATNIVPERAVLEGEVRGETTALMQYMRDRADTVFQTAADKHGCDVEIERRGEAPTATTDDAVVDVIEGVARDVAGVEQVHRHGTLGGSEDASLLMQHVQDRGGKASFVCIGTDHPGGHHTSTFDVDEDSLVIGVDVLAGAIERVAAEQP